MINFKFLMGQSITLLWNASVDILRILLQLLTQVDPAPVTTYLLLLLQRSDFTNLPGKWAIQVQ